MDGHTISPLPISEEEFSDYNSPPVFKHNGIALNPKELALFMKINEIISHLNAIID